MNFVTIASFSHKKHDFSYYTNAGVGENNVTEFAELYKQRYRIENAYKSRK